MPRCTTRIPHTVRLYSETLTEPVACPREIDFEGCDEVLTRSHGHHIRAFLR